jgi:hypothetical protein
VRIFIESLPLSTYAHPPSALRLLSRVFALIWEVPVIADCYKSLSINAVFQSLTTIKSWEWLSGKGEAQKDKESRLEL